MLLQIHIAYVFGQCFLLSQAENALVDVGEIVVGGCQSVELPLVNQSPCSVSFCLSVEETVLDNDFAIDPKNMPNGIFILFLLLESIFFKYVRLGHVRWIKLYKCTLHTAEDVTIIMLTIIYTCNMGKIM